MRRLGPEDKTMRRKKTVRGIMMEGFGNQQKRLVEIGLVLSGKQRAVSQPLVRAMEITQAWRKGKQSLAGQTEYFFREFFIP